MKLRIGLIGLCAALAGCANAPSINVLGAFFPAWMFCIAGGIVGASVIRGVLTRRNRLAGYAPGVLPLIWTALSVLLALGCWILFFKN